MPTAHGHHVTAVVLATLSLAACAPKGPKLPHQMWEKAQVTPWLASVRLVDLTHSLGPDTIFWPTSLPFTLEPVHRGWTPEGYWYAANNFRMAEHGGTHMDAPLHFGEGKLAADAVPLSACVGPAVVIDVREQAARNTDYELTVQDVLLWEQRHGPLPGGAIVVMLSGWGRYWGNKKQYLGSDQPGDTSGLRFPGFSAEAVSFLVEQRNIAALGVDTASVDPGRSRSFPVHRVLSAANKPAFENLANVEQLPPTGAWIFALPLPIVNGSGSPARVIALVPSGD